MKKFVFVLSVLISAICFSQSNDALFERGKQAYEKGEFQSAVESWQNVVDNGYESSELYYNLGNAHYKLNNVAPSIFYYEKALQLAPNDADIKNNLQFAKNATIDAIEPLPKSIFTKWYEGVSGIMNFDGWAWACVVFSILFVALFLMYYFSVGERKKRFYFAGSLLMVLLFVVSISMAFLTFGDAKNDTPAIVFAESTDVKSEPNMGSNVSFVLHEGTKVQVLSEVNNWVRIQLADGKDGWMPAADLRKL